jgi:hypothetical protein
MNKNLRIAAIIHGLRSAGYATLRGPSASDIDLLVAGPQHVGDLTEIVGVVVTSGGGGLVSTTDDGNAVIAARGVAEILAHFNVEDEMVWQAEEAEAEILAGGGF